jgi:acyl CoA:acetate/3-ketoacid CoA transferase beta subunit
MPSLTADKLQSENRVPAMGAFPFDREEDADVVIAAKQTITTLAVASFFDSEMSFGMIRGQHVDLTILGMVKRTEARWISLLLPKNNCGHDARQQKRGV